MQFATIWDRDSRIQESLLIILDPHEVNAQRVTPARRALLDLIKKKETVQAFQGRVHFAVPGYLPRPKALYMVPAICQFFRALDAKWPYWFYFIRRDSDAILVIHNLMAASFDSGFVGLDTAKSRLFVERSLQALDRLRDTGAIAHEEADAIGSEVLAKISCYMADAASRQ